MQLSNHSVGRRITPWLLMAPALAAWAVFTLWPMIMVVVYSTLKTNFLVTSAVGFQNYIDAVNTKAFRQSCINSAVYSAIMMIGNVGGALIVALTIYKSRKIWQSTVRFMLYIPALTAGIVVAPAWKWMYHYDGVFNWAIGLLGMEKVMWFSRGITAIPAVALPVLFAGLGGTVILILSAVLSVPTELYDAATIDGASPWQIKMKIVVPYIRPILSIALLMSMIGGPQIYEYIYALAPYDHAATATFRIFNDAFEMGRYGKASAESIILVVVMLAAIFVKQRMEKE